MKNGNNTGDEGNKPRYQICGVSGSMATFPPKHHC